MFVSRDLEERIRAGAQQMPVLAIVGPRQSGKSTLVKRMFKNHHYVDLQDAEMADFANRDPKGFLKSFKNEYGIILDEAQYAPALFAQIKVAADKDPHLGYYILSGSQNFLLYEKITESLAGRVYFYTLLPFSIKELKSAHLLEDTIEQQMEKGFYPRAYQPAIKATDYYANYIVTYVERDIRTIRNIENILLFKKFMQLCALRLGSTINFTALATDCGISVITAKNWLSLLETSFIIFLLPSYHNNLGKRITKSPKLYFYDVGLATALMGIDTHTLIQQRGLYGALFENMVIVDIIKHINAQAVRSSRLTFFRDTMQREVDLIIERGGITIPIEIKASQTMNSAFFDTLNWFKGQVSSAGESVVVYAGDMTQTRSQGLVVPWFDLDKI